MTEVRLMYHESKLDVTCDMCGAYTSKWTERLDRLRRCEKCDTNYYKNAFDPLYKPLSKLCLECNHDRSYHYYTQNELLGCQLCKCIVFRRFSEHDTVNHPAHYTQHPSGVECIQITEHMNFCLGNAMKYIWRANSKNGVEDLQKAIWYINREIERINAGH